MNQHCIRYETDTRLYADSASEVTLEVTYLGSITETLLFKINGSKQKGENDTVCVTSESSSNPELITVSSVRIRQTGVGWTKNDGWGIKEISLETHPGSGKYQPYSLSANETRFWTDGDDSCLEDEHKEFLCCANQDWCSLEKVQSTTEGNTIVCIYVSYLNINCKKLSVSW